MNISLCLRDYNLTLEILWYLTFKNDFFSWTSLLNYKYGSLDRTSLALETEARLFYVSKERYDVVLVKLPS